MEKIYELKATMKKECRDAVMAILQGRKDWEPSAQNLWHESIL